MEKEIEAPIEEAIELIQSSMQLKRDMGDLELEFEEAKKGTMDVETLEDYTNQLAELNDKKVKIEHEIDEKKKQLSKTRKKSKDKSFILECILVTRILTGKISASKSEDDIINLDIDEAYSGLTSSQIIEILCMNSDLNSYGFEKNYDINFSNLSQKTIAEICRSNELENYLLPQEYAELFSKIKNAKSRQVKQNRLLKLFLDKNQGSFTQTSCQVMALYLKNLFSRGIEEDNENVIIEISQDIDPYTGKPSRDIMKDDENRDSEPKDRKTGVYYNKRLQECIDEYKNLKSLRINNSDSEIIRKLLKENNVVGAINQLLNEIDQNKNVIVNDECLAQIKQIFGNTGNIKGKQDSISEIVDKLLEQQKQVRVQLTSNRVTRIIEEMYYKRTGKRLVQFRRPQSSQEVANPEDAIQI